MKKIEYFLLSLLLAAGFACQKERAPADNDHYRDFSGQIVIDWNRLAYESTADLVHPLFTARANTMMHLAMHDALNAVNPQFATYAFNGAGAGADPVAALSSAAYLVLKTSYPGKEAQYKEFYEQSLATVAEGEAKTKGVKLGFAAAEAILALRKNDDAFGDPASTVEPSEAPGLYQAVPPLDYLYGAGWETMQPFGLAAVSQFRSPAPPALGSEIYAEDFAEVKAIGKDGSAQRTQEQSDAAKFWYELSELGWNRIGRIAAAERDLPLWEAARLFALLNTGLIDAYLAGWDSKFHYNFWRPYTAIRRAAHDGNGQTAPDENWQSAEPTPPVQDYPSTHSALGNAGATILTTLLGENFAFTTVSASLGAEKVSRSFPSFLAAADENAASRVYGGLHFRFSCDAGQQLGNQVGRWVVENMLKPAELK